MGSAGPRPSLVARGLWLCSLVTVYVARQPAFLCLSPHNGEYVAAFRCLRCSQALANPSTQGGSTFNRFCRTRSECFHLTTSEQWKSVVSIWTHYSLCNKQNLQWRFWKKFRKWSCFLFKLPHCFALTFFFPSAIALFSICFKKCLHVYFKPFSPLFILLQPFCFRSCSDATAAQTPFPPADSVASLRRCGLRVLVVGRTRGWGCEAPTSGPPAYHMLGKRAG